MVNSTSRTDPELSDCVITAGRGTETDLVKP